MALSLGAQSPPPRNSTSGLCATVNRRQLSLLPTAVFTDHNCIFWEGCLFVFQDTYSVVHYIYD